MSKKLARELKKLSEYYTKKNQYKFFGEWTIFYAKYT